jgi:predicted permease
MVELRHAIRRLLTDRWSAGGAVLVAALGAGLNTAVFAVAFGVLARPLPYAAVERQVVLSTDAALPEVDQWRARLPMFESFSASGRASLTVYGAGDPRLANVAIVDGRFFETLGGRTLVGRMFGHGEPACAVVSEQFARQASGPPERLVGAGLTVGDVPVTVTGVLPAAFAFPSEQIDIWMPAESAREVMLGTSDIRRFKLFGRLKPGATRADAAAAATRAAGELDPTNRRRDKGPVRVDRLEDALVGSVRPVLLAFTAAGAIVLLIASANVASILIGRTLSRQRELAIRRALGASPGRLFASVVYESLVISIAGALLGIAGATMSIRVVADWAAGIIPRLNEIRIDWVVLLFATVVSTAAALLAALPVVRAAGATTYNVRNATAGVRPADRRVRGALVVVQIALAVVLLAGGGLLARTITGLLRADIGVATDRTVVSHVMLTHGVSFTAATRGPVLREIVRRVRELPGVTAAGAGTTLPPENSSIEITVRVMRDNYDSVQRFAVSSVTPGYLPAIGARILDGRDFADADEHRDRLGIVISESAARALMPIGAVAVGREFPMALPGPLRSRGRPIVIGVVSDIKYSGLEARRGAAVYVLWNDFPAGQTFLAVRGSRSAASIAAELPASLRAILHDVDPGMPVTPVRTLDEVIATTVADRRLRALLGGAVALLAFAVAMVGLAASLMRAVLERRHEIAIRAALGATPNRAIRAVVREGAGLAGAGVLLGIGGALIAGRALRSLIFGVSPYDAATLAAVAGLVGGFSLLACYLPARRAARVDPLVVLRGE